MSPDADDPMKADTEAHGLHDSAQPRPWPTWEGEYRSALAGRAMLDVSSHGTLEVAGPEALVFLHNLTSNDVKGLAPGQTRESFLTTLKAKTIAHIWITRLVQDGDPVLWLTTEPGMNETVLRHLDRHLISERVELVDRTSEFGRLRLFHRTDDVLAAKPGTTLISLSGFGRPVTDVVSAKADFESVRNDWRSVGFSPMGSEPYEVLRIEAGLPKMGLEMDDSRFVVELDRTAQAISYAKGCYLGQEPIVMARDRGQVNRLLRGLSFDFVELPKPGSTLFRGEAEAGKITSVTFSPRLGHGIALAFLRRGHWEPGTEVFLDKSGTDRPLRVTPLPFA